MFESIKVNRKLLIAGGLFVVLFFIAIIGLYNAGIFPAGNPQDACLKRIENLSAGELYVKILDLGNSSLKENLEIIKGLSDNLNCGLLRFPRVKDINLFADFIKNYGLSEDEAASLLGSAEESYEKGLKTRFFSGAIVFFDFETLCPGGKEEPILTESCVKLSTMPKKYDNKIITYDSETVKAACGDYCGLILKYENNPSVFAAELRSYVGEKKRLRRGDFEDFFWLLLALRYGDENIQKEFCGYYDLSEQPACLDTVQNFSNFERPESVKNRECRFIFDRVKTDICRIFPHI